ncbi:MAG: TPM domain-containing protein [Polyangiaceae bacterium]|nr:TPM domain-containing protein [Polyangiaceae bacterium]
MPALHEHPKLLSKRDRSWWVRAVGFIAVILALGLFGSTVVAQAGAPPIPPPPTQWLTDSVDLLPPEVEQTLNQRLADYEHQTGHQVVVWIGATTGILPVRDFAVKTFASWQLGRKKLDDGLLLVVLAQDRKLAIEVGYGLEDRVPDAVAARIINDVMVPKLRAGDTSAALSDGIDATLEAISGKPFAARPPALPPEDPAQSSGPGKAQLVVLGLLLLGFLLLAVTHPTLALSLLWVLTSGGRGGGGFGGGGGGFGGGGGGRSGGGGASGSW